MVKVIKREYIVECLRNLMKRMEFHSFFSDFSRQMYKYRYSRPIFDLIDNPKISIEVSGNNAYILRKDSQEITLKELISELGVEFLQRAYDYNQKLAKDNMINKVIADFIASKVKGIKLNLIVEEFDNQHCGFYEYTIVTENLSNNKIKELSNFVAEEYQVETSIENGLITFNSQEELNFDNINSNANVNVKLSKLSTTYRRFNGEKIDPSKGEMVSECYIDEKAIKYDFEESINAQGETEYKYKLNINGISDLDKDIINRLLEFYLYDIKPDMSIDFLIKSYTIEERDNKMIISDRNDCHQRFEKALEFIGKSLGVKVYKNGVEQQFKENGRKVRIKK